MCWKRQAIEAAEGLAGSHGEESRGQGKGVKEGGEGVDSRTGCPLAAGPLSDLASIVVLTLEYHWPAVT